MLLAEFSYDIHYRPGPSNAGADGLSRLTHQVGLVVTNGSGPGSIDKMKDTSALIQLHRTYGHPGVTRLWHLVQSKNLAFELSDIKLVCGTCGVCSSTKPKQFQSEPSTMV